MANPKDHPLPGAKPSGDDSLVRESSGPPSATKKRRKTLNLSLRDEENRILSAHYLKETWEILKFLCLIPEIVEQVEHVKRFLENHHF
jgi:hypothetical protein